MPIYSIIPKTPAAKGKAKEAPATMPVGRTTRARVAASKDKSPEQEESVAPSKIPQTARKAPTRTNTPEVAELKQTPMMKRIASFNIMTKNTRTPSATSKSETQTGKETMQAFLRIRPPPSSHELLDRVKPYLEMQGEKQVIMRAPQDFTRPNQAPKPTQIYSFNHVFGPDTPQNTFFETTTLPLVEQALQGESGLMFSYGVSNSGKTYTIQGGGDDKTQGADRGMIPRSIDVIFNSIEGLECTIPIKPVRQYGVEIGTVVEDDSMAQGYGAAASAESYRDETTIKVDRNFSYAVYLSYVEVYNEKIFDLLESIPTTNSKEQPKKPTTRPSSSAVRTSSAMQRSFSQAFGSFGNRMSMAAAANGGNGIIKRQALALKNDLDGGKYVAGLKEIRVKTREEAHAIFKLGQIDRQVFGTGQNQQSSRSHGIFTVKIVKIHNGAPNDAQSAQVARLSIVDLAGSERTKNTHNAGERLREAANINTSLMTLGQCMETLRANQALLADKSMQGRRKPAIVPFRHSKLTEMFQGFFAGQGRAVMIVHVNPYDTGFDENSHVMRFSSIAREIQTTAFNKMSIPFMRGIDAFRNAVTPMKVRVPVPVLKPSKLDIASPTEQYIEEEMQVQEVDPEDDSDYEQDLLVQFLFDEIKDLRVKVVEAEMRNATLEAEIREEASLEMAQNLQRLESMYAKRLREQSEASELKTDMKIDIMQRGMGAMGGFRDADGTMDSDSSMLEAAIDQSLMADDENEISARTESTATDGMNSSGSYTASPTPASRAPGHGFLINGTKQFQPPTDVTELPAIPSVRFQIPEVDDGSAPQQGPSCVGEEDVDMERFTSSGSERWIKAHTSGDSTHSVSKSPAVSSNHKSAAGESNAIEEDAPASATNAEQGPQAAVSGPQELAVSPSIETTAEDHTNGSSGRETPDEDSEEESESEEDSEDDSESEEDELDESHEDSSFEVDADVASESSDEEEPAPRKPSRRRSSVAAVTPAKVRKSAANSQPVIMEAEKEEDEDEGIAQKKTSTRQSRWEPSKPNDDNAVDKQHTPLSARTPLAESKTQEIAVPVRDMADLELDELSDAPVTQKKPEPIKKKKRKLGKVAVITEEDIELDTAAKLSLNGGGGNVRRMVQRG
ncbi:hypothetical protein QFC21_002680 [Naganishia friedmannii]|uniref:Uncharacterized protein n=1 Tax=Naganishia friedmannii TaxID=89922 RepID=A0ACC2VWL5_9TREE|nr:hypothetical protein QFC21_002680 [Naganishia friedmannii]